MFIHRIAPVLLLSTLAAACAASEPTAATTTSADTNAPAELFTWPAPAHWGVETIPFPLPFAQSLPYTGVLELRFMPSFFTPGTPTYFSYDFVWQIDSATAFTADGLARDMTTYYAGLAQSSDADHFDASVHHAEFTAVAPDHFTGKIHTQDGFNGDVAVDLNADVTTSSCNGKLVALFTISPATADSDTWSSLQTQRGAFVCTAQK